MESGADQLSWGEDRAGPAFFAYPAFGMNDRRIVHTPDTSRFAAFPLPAAAAREANSGCRPTPQWPADYVDLPAAPRGAAPRSQGSRPGSRAINDSPLSIQGW
jgi:hypothetical protein